MIWALALFAVTYVLMLIFDKYRPFIAIGSAIIFIVSGMLPLSKIAESTNIPADANVLLMIAGTMGLVALFTESKMPDRLADILISKMPNVKWAIVALALFAGIISAFVDNVSTVLMIAPVALLIAKKLNINPVPMIIAIAVSSNLQGAATLVGDTTAIMLGSFNNMNFMDFFWFQGKPGIFFAVELGAVMSALILLVMFRKDNEKLPKQELTKVKDYVPTFLLCFAVVLLIVASFLPDMPETINGIICCSLFVVGIIYTLIKRKQEAGKVLKQAFKEIDFNTIGLLFGLFLVIAGINNMGVISEAAGLLAKVGGDNVFLIYTVIVWGSVLFSAFIDNIPFVATMLPVIQGLAAQLGIDPSVLYFGLLTGATLGGNLTPIGASANITGINILRKEGNTVKNSDFFKIGIPFTLAAVIPGYIYCWLVFGV